MRLIHSNRSVGLFGLLMATMLLAGCGSFFGTNTPAPVVNQAEIQRTLAQDPLRVGDKIRIDLTGLTGQPVPIPPSEQIIKDDGTITMTYLPPVKAAGKTPGQLEADIQGLYVPDIYRQITVSVTPMERFYYVGGQVWKSGAQPYVGAVTVTKAIQAAGDFTEFADRKNIQVTRVHGKVEWVNFNKIRKHPELDLPIYPGDSIIVDRRAF